MICLLSAAGLLTATLATDIFTLSWRHSVEKVEWQEEWRVEDGRLVASAARVQGSGAGMEPGPDARLENGWWVWRPALPPQPRLVLTRSNFTTDYTLCWNGSCSEMGSLSPLPPAASITIITPCQ